VIAKKTALIDPEMLAEAARICACFGLRKAARAVTQLYDNVLQPSGLRSTQFVILVAIGAEGTVRLPDLTRTLNVDRSTLTRNLQPLERDGLLRVTEGTKDRASTVRLTKKGQRTLAATVPLWQEAQARFEAQIGGRRWQAILRDLNRVVDAAHEA